MVARTPRLYVPNVETTRLVRDEHVGVSDVVVRERDAAGAE